MPIAIGIIQAEHRSYAAVLDCLHNLARDIGARGQSPDFELFYLVLEYVRDFIDRYHHPKEDHYLFKTLRRRAPEIAPALDELEAEHRRGTELITALDWTLRQYQGVGEAAYFAFRDSVQHYVAFERAHMKREETRIIPLARARLTIEDWQTIDNAFLENDDPVFGAVPTKRFEKLFTTIVAMAPAPYGVGAQWPKP